MHHVTGVLYLRPLYMSCDWGLVHKAPIYIYIYTSCDWGLVPEAPT